MTGCESSGGAAVPETISRPRRGLALGGGTGLVVIVLTLAVIGLALHHNLRAIDRRIERIIQVEEPTSAAAHELEINVLGTGLGVWKYIATGGAEHRKRVDKDKSDFRRFRAEYERLATTAVEVELGERLDALYEPYSRLSSVLLDTRDEFVARLRRATDGFDAIDRIVDDSIQTGIDASSPGGQVKLLTSTAIEADVAECLASVGVYVADPAPSNRERVDLATAEARDQAEAFLALELTPEERTRGNEVQHTLDSALAEIEQAVVLQDALRRDGAAFIALQYQLDDLLDEGIQVLAREELAAAHPEATFSVHRVYVGSMIVLSLGAVVCIAAAGVLAYRSVQLDSANRELRQEFARREESEAARSLLLRDLASVQEQERGRLARELHDQMGQDLSALLLGLKSLESPHPPGSRTAGGSGLPQLQELARRLIQQVHTIAWELRPATLDDLGLHGALSALLEQWTERSGVPSDFESNLEGQRLPGPVEIVLYRIAQEALTNVLKHARARSVSVTLQRRGHEVVMVVEDDGAGFAPAQILSPSSVVSGHLGLLGMKERAALAKGALEVESAPGRGTTLVARIPLS